MNMLRRLHHFQLCSWEQTRSSAATEGQHDALRQMKSCQLPHSSTKNRVLKGWQ